MITDQGYMTLEFDCGSLTYDAKGVVSYLKKSKEYFQHQLLEIGEQPDFSGFSQEQQKALLCWNEVGQHIRETCNKSIFSFFFFTFPLLHEEKLQTSDQILTGRIIQMCAKYSSTRCYDT